MFNNENDKRSSSSGFTVENALRAFSYLMKKDFKKYMTVAMPIAIGIIGIGYIFFRDLASIPDVSGLSPEQQLEIYLPYWQRAVLNMIMISVLCALPIGSISFGVMQGFRGESYSIRESILVVQKYLAASVIACVIAVISINIGFFFLFLPGFILVILFIPVVPVCILEQRGALSALKRSITLMASFQIGLKAFLLVFMLWLLFFLFQNIIVILLQDIFYLRMALVILLEGLWIVSMSVLTAVIYFYILSEKEHKNADYIARQIFQTDKADYDGSDD